MLIINRHSNILYWLVVVLMSIAIGVLEMAIAYPFISKCNVHIIEKYGFWHYYSQHTFMIVSRNVAFNFFPFMFGERKQLHEALDAEVRFIYKNAQMLDVCDDQNNCLHIPVDNILYCSKNGNETEVYTVDGEKHTRYCTLKYLIQLLGNGEFIRISSSVIVPFQHIASCDGKAVVLKSVPWSKTPLSFQLDTKRAPQIAAVIDEYLHADHVEKNGTLPDSEEDKGKKNPSIPPKEKLDTVFNYIKKHPGCRSTELIAHTSYSQTTMDRCLFELKKQGLIEYTGSKKSGGYHPIG